MAALEQETEDVIPSLLHYVEPTPDAVSKIQLGWGEIFPDLPSSEGEIDKFLLAASQNYDHEVETDPVDDLDELLLQASQIFEGSELPAFTFAQSKNSSGRFGALRSSEDVERVKNDRIPEKTRANTAWSTFLFAQYCTYMISVVGTHMTGLAYLATEMSNCNHRVSY